MAPKENNQELRAKGTRSPYVDENGRENLFEEVTFKLRHAVSQVRGREKSGARAKGSRQTERGAKALRQKMPRKRGPRARR